MQLRYLQILQRLQEAQVRYVLVGGFAVAVQGHPRFTKDLDLVIDLEPEPALKAIEILAGEGLMPRVPVDPKDFADPDLRRRWIEEKHMQVFSMQDPDSPLTVVDLFVEDPVPFAELWDQSEIRSLAGFPVRVASIDHLIQMKKQAGRAIDEEDIVALEELRKERE